MKGNLDSGIGEIFANWMRSLGNFLLESRILGSAIPNTAHGNFHVFLPTKFVSSAFKSLFLKALALSVIHVRIDIKHYVDKDSTLFMFFLSKCPGSNAISRQKHLVSPVVSYLLIELFYIGMPVMQADGRTVGRTVTWSPKGLPNFLRYRAPLGRGARRSLPLWGYRNELRSR